MIFQINSSRLLLKLLHFQTTLIKRIHHIKSFLRLLYLKSTIFFFNLLRSLSITITIQMKILQIWLHLYRKLLLLIIETVIIILSILLLLLNLVLFAVELISILTKIFEEVWLFVHYVNIFDRFVFAKEIFIV